MRILGLLSSLLLLLVSELSAQTFSGRLTSSVYSFERQTSGVAATRQFRGYQTAALDISGRGHLSFHTYVRGTHDFATAAPEDPRLKIFSAYLRLHRLPGGTNIRLGRQYIFAGVGQGAIDGLAATVKVSPRVTLSGHAGTLAPYGKGQQFIGWQEGHMLGGAVSLHLTPTTTFRASFARRNREAFAVDPQGNRRRVNSLQRQLLGFDLYGAVTRRLGYYGRLDLDLAGLSSAAAGDNVRVKRSELQLRYDSPGHFSVTAEHLFRRPVISANSFFINFRELVRSNHETGILGEYRFLHNLSGNVRYAVVKYHRDTTHRLNVGLQYAEMYLGYVKRLGYGGERDGIVGDAYLPVTETLRLRAGADFSTLRLIEDAPQENRIFATYAGLHYRPHKQWTLDLEVQELRQTIRNLNFLDTVAFPGADHDVRFFLRASFWFFERTGDSRPTGDTL